MSKLDDLRIDSPVARPRRRRRMPWVPIITFLFIIAVLAYFQRDQLAELLPEDRPSQSEAEDTSGDAVTAIPASASAGPPGSISAAGYLEVVPPGPTIVSSLVAGRVAELTVIPGQRVTAGQEIARLDSSPLRQDAARLGSRVELARSELRRQQAGFRSQEIDQAEAALSGAESRLALAESSLARAQQLFDKGVISRQEYEELESAVREAEADVFAARSNLELYRAGTRVEDVQIAEARLSAAQAELSAVNWEIGQCAITAPVDGVVLEQFAHPGAWVAPGRDDPMGGAVISIFDPRNLQAWVDVNQRDSAGLFLGQQVEMTTDAEPQRPVVGTVSQIMPQANLQKNTVQVKIAIPDPPEDFRPELSVKVVFLPAGDEAQGMDPPGAADDPDGGADSIPAGEEDTNVS